MQQIKAVSKQSEEASRMADELFENEVKKARKRCHQSILVSVAAIVISIASVISEILFAQ